MKYCDSSSRWASSRCWQLMAASTTACAVCAAVLPLSSSRPARTRRRTRSSNRFLTMGRHLLAAPYRGSSSPHQGLSSVPEGSIGSLGRGLHLTTSSLRQQGTLEADAVLNQRQSGHIGVILFFVQRVAL